MAEQISSDNTKKLLLEGGGAKAAPQPRPARPHRRSGNADNVVENTTEKRYLSTAQAIPDIKAVSQ